MKLRYTLAITLALILVISSCKPAGRKDISLTLNEYQVLGMPDISKPWDEEQIIKAHIALSNARMKNFQTLPRKGSSRSGDVFRRLLSHDNLSFLDDATSLYDKGFRIQSFWSFLNDVGLMYTDNFRVEQYYNEELIDIYSFQLFVRNKMFLLADRIDGSKDPMDVGLQRGRPGIVSGYVYLVQFMIDQQEKTKSFTPRQLKTLSREISLSVKENIKYLDGDSKKKIADEINKISEKNISGSVKKDLAKLLKDLSN